LSFEFKTRQNKAKSQKMWLEKMGFWVWIWIFEWPEDLIRKGYGC